MATLVHSPVPQLLAIPTGSPPLKNINFIFFSFFCPQMKKINVLNIKQYM